MKAFFLLSLIHTVCLGREAQYVLPNTTQPVAPWLPQGAGTAPTPEHSLHLWEQNLGPSSARCPIATQEQQGPPQGLSPGQPPRN